MLDLKEMALLVDAVFAIERLNEISETLTGSSLQNEFSRLDNVFEVVLRNSKYDDPEKILNIIKSKNITAQEKAKIIMM